MKIYKLDSMGKQIELKSEEEKITHLLSIIDQCQKIIENHENAGSFYNGCDIDAGLLSSRIYFLKKR